MNEINFDTKFGQVTFKNTNLVDCVDVYIDDEYIGEIADYSISDLKDYRVNEIEEIISIYCFI